MNKDFYMKRALTLARRGRTSPNPMVGAVVVHDGVIVGEGYHPKAGEPHAEVFALRAAGDLASGADLYVTLEPCCHYGKTPPCAEAVIQAGVRRVFAAMVDPNPIVAGKGLERLRSAGIEVEVGIMEDAARALNEAFIKRVTTGLPYVTWKAAMTLDGKIATRTGSSRWVTGERAREEVHRLRARCDAVMVGSGTIRTDDPELTVRGIRGSVNPIRLVVDSKACTPPDARVLNVESRTIIAVTGKAPKNRVDVLGNTGAEILVLQDIGGRVDLRALMLKLSDMGINSILLESGGELAASMLAEGLVDKGLIFIAPKIAGGRDARTPVEGEGVANMSDVLTTTVPRVQRFGDDIALEFKF